MFFSRISHLAGKIRSRGSHLAGKIRSNVGSTAGKIKNTIHDLRVFIDRVKKVAPIATEIIDDVSDLIPGARLLKKGVSYGVSALDTLSNVSQKANSVAAGTENFVNNPNLRSFRELVGNF